MPSLICGCGEVLHYGEIPCPKELIIYLEINDWLLHIYYYLIPNPLKPLIRCT